MRIFKPKNAPASGLAPLPDLTRAPRELRSALSAAVQRSLRAVSQGGRQGRSVQDQPLAQRAAAVEQFWRFLEAELSKQGKTSLAVLADSPGGAAAQEVCNWLAHQCGIRPSLVACVNWAGQFDKQAREAYAQVHPGEPAWKYEAEGPAFFAAVGEAGEAGTPVDGVVRVRADGLALLVPAFSSETEFSKESVHGVRAEADGLRLEVGPPLPYGSLLLLAASGAARLKAALKRAGIDQE